ncbi:MAG: flippase-like domain-containing protein [Candidatus Kerfeldbacteria bacterium]|nr:flippase-like domain-containing protein [Candidatus Kerfeldbacteria bacterium]
MTKPTPRRWWRALVQWGVAILVLWFVFRRLASDWPTVQEAVANVNWIWLVVSILPGVLYFHLRVRGWQAILHGWGIQPRHRSVFVVWMKAEALRFVPGTVWAVLGRMAQAALLKTSRSIIGITLLQEGLLMLLAAVFLVAALALPIPEMLQVPAFFPWAVLAISVFAVGLLLHPKTGAVLGRTASRLLRRGEFALSTSRGETEALPLLLTAWGAFALFQVLIAQAFGFVGSFLDAVVFSIAFVAGWVVGYVTIFAPSGIGVREGIVVVMLTPFVGATNALVIAAITRVGLLVVELALVGIAVAVSSRQQKEEAPT